VNDCDFHDEFYRHDAERIFSSPLYRELLAVQVRFLVKMTPRAAHARVLSLGCGDGTRELAMAPHVRRIIGVDIAPLAIAAARERGVRAGVENVEFRVGDVESLDRTTAPPIDCIWCGGVLHHLADRKIDTVVKGSSALLDSGGAFIAMEPSAYRAVGLLKPLFRRQYDKFHSPEERELRPRDLLRRIVACGFEHVDLYYLDWFLSPLAWVFPDVSPLLARQLRRLDQLLVRTPLLKHVSSGFAIVARKPARTKRHQQAEP
jgi:SAM-dependent methyltransferase